MSATTITAIRDLSTLTSASLPEAGGKGANLGELLAAGIPVPEGFVVTVAAYRATLAAADTAAVDAALAAADYARVRELVAAVTIPAELRTAVVDAYRDLGGGPVAVRSSGTAEDLADAAFAGQHDTYLNIVGEAALVDAVRDCWASLWTDRAAEYRREKGIDSAEVAIAVVVQRMIPAEAAGVMFTADPVGGRRDRMVIDASPGLGEAVVSGLVTPDHYLVRKDNGRVLDSRLGRREVVIRGVAGGGTVETREDAGTDPVLDLGTVKDLVRLGRRVEAHFKAPQDTEWALADGRLYLVQARPITAMPRPLGKVGRRRRMLASILAEIISQRPYPLDLSTWTERAFAGVRLFGSSMGLVFPTLESMLVLDEDGVLERIEPGAPRPSLALPYLVTRNLIRGRRFPTARWQQDPRLAAFLADTAALRDRDLTELPYRRLADVLAEALAMIDPIMSLRYDYLPRAVLAAARFRLTLALLRRGELFGLLLSGAETKTGETNRELERLAQRIRADETLAAAFADSEVAELSEVLRGSRSGRSFLVDFDAFLAEYGHREITSIALVSQPVWRDSPDTVLGILKGMTSTPPSPTKQTAAQRAEAELFAHPRLRDPRRRARVADRLAAARRFTSFREDTHFQLTRPQPLVRRVLLEYGDRLTRAGVLPEPAAVFGLRREELTDLSWPPSPAEADRLRELAAHRLAAHAALGDGPVVDRRYFATANRADALVTGTPASAGRYTGPVRIVRGPQDFHLLRDGEVLVAPFTNPAWTPLFQRAGAVIVDTGAAMSHAAIVAREYGIPAVLGTVEAVGSLTDGQSVTVDGDAGVVLAAV